MLIALKDHSFYNLLIFTTAGVIAMWWPNVSRPYLLNDNRSPQPQNSTKSSFSLKSHLNETASYTPLSLSSHLKETASCTKPSLNSHLSETASCTSPCLNGHLSGTTICTPYPLNNHLNETASCIPLALIVTSMKQPIVTHSLFIQSSQ